MNATRILLALAACCGALAAQSARAQTWTQPLDYPGSSHTYASGISGSTIAGFYYDGSFTAHALTYNINTSAFASLDDPSAVGGGTWAYGVSGSTIVGNYYTHSGANNYTYGFTYDGTNWTTLNDPSAVATIGGTVARGLSGANVAGYYLNASDGLQGFVENGGVYTNLQAPSADPAYGTEFLGIDGNNIVGCYFDATAVVHGVLYNLLSNSWMTLDYPGSTGTNLDGISGNEIFGTYQDGSGYNHAFLYNTVTSSWTSIDDPLAMSPGGTFAGGIEGANLVGFYTDFMGDHGFLATVPEPASLSLLACGMIGMGLTIRRRRAAK